MLVKCAIASLQKNKMKKGDTFNHNFVVSEEVYNKFVELFLDRNPLHTDTAFSKSKGFKDKVMHGNILNGFVSFFVGECLPCKNVIIHSQQIKFSKPVYMDDHLNFFARIEGIYESVNAVEFNFYFENQNKVKVANGKIQIGLLV